MLPMLLMTWVLTAEPTKLWMLVEAKDAAAVRA